MSQTVYIDTLIFINTLINFYILFITGLVTHSRILKWRILLGGFLGGILSLSVILPEMNEVLSLALKALASGGIILVSFELGGKSRFFRRYIAYVVVNFLFAGAVLFCCLVLKTPLIYYNNANFYFDISTPFLLIIATITYILLKTTVKRSNAPMHIQKYYDLEIYKLGQKAKCVALSDTGNSLKDVFTGTPVIVVDYLVASRLLPDEYRTYFSDTPIEIKSLLPDIRLIPYKDVTGDGFLKAFRSDEVRVISEDKCYKLKNGYIAVYNGNLSKGNYEAIINPEIFDIVREVA